MDKLNGAGWSATHLDIPLAEGIALAREVDPTFLNHKPKVPEEIREMARAAVEAAQGADSPASMGEAIAKTADMSQNSAGLTFANSPMHAVRLGGPGATTMPNSPAPSRYGSVLEGGQPVANPDDLIGGANNPVPTPDGKPR